MKKASSILYVSFRVVNVDQNSLKVKTVGRDGIDEEEERNAVFLSSLCMSIGFIFCLLLKMQLAAQFYARIGNFSKRHTYFFTGLILREQIS